MNEIQITQDTTITSNAILNEGLYSRWTSYIDAMPKTVETYTRAIKQFYTYLHENGISQPKREDVITYRDYLKQDHKPTTVQSYLAAVKLFFRWTAQENLYPNIAEHIKGAKLDTEHKKDYLTTKQTNKVLGAVDRSNLKGLRDYALLTLMVTTGLRTISIIRADITDIRTAGDDTALYYQGKGHEEKADYVKLAEPVEEALRAYLNAREDKDQTAPLFASISNRNSNERMTTKSISRICKESLIAAGYDSDRLTAHSFRHTAATLNLMNGASVGNPTTIRTQKH